jgi:hypothetical protein
LIFSEETPQKLNDYRPVFFEGRPLWSPEPSNDRPIQSARSMDERQPSGWSSIRVCLYFIIIFSPHIFFFVQPTNQNNNNNGSSINHNTTFVRQPSPATHFDTSTVDRSTKNGVVENYNGQMQNEHAWAIERKRAGAK